MGKSDFVVWFKDVDKDDIKLVGGKGANLGEMTRAGFPVPNGFSVTSLAYYNFIKQNDLTTKINHLLKTTNYDKQESLNQVSKHIKKFIMDGKMDNTLIHDIYKAYETLSGPLKHALVAVRSSATAEDLPGASFAGQQETFLNVQGDANVLLKVKEAWASLFNARAIFYRHEQKFDHFRIGIAIPVQKMVSSEKSGIMFTIDPVNNDKTKIVVEAIYGLGELIVQGAVTPDHYEVSKNDGKIVAKITANQKKMLKKVGSGNKEIKIISFVGKRQKITDKQILDLAFLGQKLEKHYYFPQDVEWAIEKEKIYLVQTRPITTMHTSKASKLEQEEPNKTLPLIVKGSPASPGIASGPARVVMGASEINKVLPGEILVAPQTNPDFVPAMRKAVAIVTDMGGRTSHAAIVSRELGIPSVVGAENATKHIKTGEIITVHGGKGEVYKGGFKTQIQTPKQVVPFLKTVTRVYLNLAEPELADKVSKRHVDGIGLLRAEFMIAQIGIHPKKLIKEGRKRFFVEKLAQDLEKFASVFNPRPIVYRATDFKSNEYRELTGGNQYEPHEPNPMLGYRGAYRYIHDPEVFELELEAIKIVRNKKGFKNLWMMLPFVRSVKELLEVKKIIAAAGLTRSSSFKLWMMVEIPANVILLDKCIEAGIDGVSIGSNDLTMLLLGTDRDNSEVAPEFDERNEAVLWALEKTIKTAHKHGITASICGQAPSQYPDLVEKLVKWGITSISVSPDAIDHTRELISNCEKKLIK